MWRQVRGMGLSYNYRMACYPDVGHLYFELFKSSQLLQAYKVAKEIMVSEGEEGEGGGTGERWRWEGGRERGGREKGGKERGRGEGEGREGREGLHALNRLVPSRPCSNYYIVTCGK